MRQLAYSRVAGKVVCTCLLCSLAFAIGFITSLPLVLAQLVVVVLCRHARVRWSDWISRDDSRSSLSSDRDAQGHVIKPLTVVSHAVLECSAVKAAERRICRTFLSSYFASRLAKSRGRCIGC